MSARALGEADQPVREVAPMLGIDVGRDQRSRSPRRSCARPIEPPSRTLRRAVRRCRRATRTELLEILTPELVRTVKDESDGDEATLRRGRFWGYARRWIDCPPCGRCRPRTRCCCRCWCCHGCATRSIPTATACAIGPPGLAGVHLRVRTAAAVAAGHRDSPAESCSRCAASCPRRAAGRAGSSTRASSSTRRCGWRRSSPRPRRATTTLAGRPIIAEGTPPPDETELETDAGEPFTMVDSAPPDYAAASRSRPRPLRRPRRPRRSQRPRRSRAWRSRARRSRARRPPRAVAPATRRPGRPRLPGRRRPQPGGAVPTPPSWGRERSAAPGTPRPLGTTRSGSGRGGQRPQAAAAELAGVAGAASGARGRGS